MNFIQQTDLWFKSVKEALSKHVLGNLSCIIVLYVATRADQFESYLLEYALPLDEKSARAVVDTLIADKEKDSLIASYFLKARKHFAYSRNQFEFFIATTKYRQ